MKPRIDQLGHLPLSHGMAFSAPPILADGVVRSVRARADTNDPEDTVTGPCALAIGSSVRAACRQRQRRA